MKSVFYLRFEDGGYVIHPLLGNPYVFSTEENAAKFADRYDDERRPVPERALLFEEYEVSL